MSSNEHKETKSAYEYATDTCGWNITKEDSAKLFKLFTEEIKKSTDKNKD